MARTYDPKCLELAKAFIEDHPGGDAVELAKRIQETVDDYSLEVPDPCPRCGAPPHVSQVDAYARIYCERCYNGDPGECGGGIGRINAVEDWNAIVANWEGE